MEPHTRLDDRRCRLVGRPHPAADPHDRQVDSHRRVGAWHRLRRVRRPRGGGPHGGARHPACAVARRPRRRVAPWAYRRAERGVVAASCESSQRPVVAWAGGGVVDPPGPRRRSGRRAWLRSFGRCLVLSLPDRPADVDHRRLDGLVRAAVAKAAARPGARRCRLCHEPAQLGQPERVHAGHPRAHACAAAMDQLHNVSRQRHTRAGQVDRRRALGLLGERARRHGRPDLSGGAATADVHRGQDCSDGVQRLFQLGSAPGAPQPPGHSRRRRARRTDRILDRGVVARTANPNGSDSVHVHLLVGIWSPLLPRG